MNRKRIFDCFIFFNELELLRLRLEELYEYVDFFVICEAAMTFQGDPKILHYKANETQFEKYHDKIIHVVVETFPAQPDRVENVDLDRDRSADWAREHYQRNYIRQALGNALPDDVIVISDSDEIMRPETVQYLRANNGYFLLDMAMYQFFFNMQAQTEGWRKPFAYTYALDGRIRDYNRNRSNELQCFQEFGADGHYVRNSGWHFTYLGGPEQVRNKLTAFSHTSGWHRKMRDVATLQEQMLALREVGGTKPLKFCRIDNTFPTALQSRVLEYEQKGLVKKEFDRLQELESLWRIVDGRFQELLEVQQQSLHIIDNLRSQISNLSPPRDTAINLLPSENFELAWDPGMQVERATPARQLDLPNPGGVVMTHYRNGDMVRDPNVGYFSRIPLTVGKVYTASCFIWIPVGSAVDGVDLTLESWNEQTKIIADLSLRDQWQTIVATGTAPATLIGGTIVLRIYSRQRCQIHSACWQLEEGHARTPLYNISAGAIPTPDGETTC